MVFDAEDKIIVGRVQDIDDIISFHGESVSEFESSFPSTSGQNARLAGQRERPLPLGRAQRSPKLS